MTNGILEVIYDKDQVWKLAKSTGKEDDKARAKHLRNRVKDIIRSAKKDFTQEELIREDTATKEFWEKVNYLLPSRDSGNTIRLMDAGQNEVIEEEDLPGYVSACFTGIGPKLGSNCLITGFLICQITKVT